MKNRVMLDLAGNDVFSFGFICLSSGFDSPVIRLRAARCEINFVGFGSQGLCDGLACLCDGFFRWSCKLIHRRRVSIVFCEIWQHCLHDLWSGFGCCRIVKINCFFHVVVIRLSVVIKLKASSTHFIIFAYSYHCNRISSYFFLNKVILCNNPHLRGPFYERFLPQALHDHWNFTSDCGWICRPDPWIFLSDLFIPHHRGGGTGALQSGTSSLRYLLCTLRRFYPDCHFPLHRGQSVPPEAVSLHRTDDLPFHRCDFSHDPVCRFPVSG